MKRFLTLKIGNSTRFIFIVMTLMVVSASVLMANYSDNMSTSTDLVINGKSDYTIVIPKNAYPECKQAASELQQYLKQISGAELPIVVESKNLPMKMIIIGKIAALDQIADGINLSGLGVDGFAIKTASPHLIIAGGDSNGRYDWFPTGINSVGRPIWGYGLRRMGVLYGVHTFLEDTLGCRWFTSTVSHIPKSSSISISDLNIRQKPDLEYMSIGYNDASLPGFYDIIRQSFGPSDGKVHTFCELVPESKYLIDHPEYFSLSGGKRVGGQYAGQLCLTNQDTIRIATETVLGWIKDNPNIKIFSLSQNDNANKCECDNCMAVEKQEESPMGPVVYFINAIVEKVEKLHPDVTYSTLAYRYAEKPPKTIKPNPKVRIMLCPVPCEYHVYDKCNHPLTLEFMEHLRGWRKLTEHLDIWHYSVNFMHEIAPIPDIDQFQGNIKLYDKLGVDYVCINGYYASAGSGGYMDGLKTYLLSKLLWNADTDAWKVTKDYCLGYYGKAGKPIYKWLQLLHKEARDRKMHGSYWSSRDYRDNHKGASQPYGPYLYLPLMTPEIIAKSNKLFDEAQKLADNEEVLKRVGHARMSLEYVEMMFAVQKAYETPNEAGLKDKAVKLVDEFENNCKYYDVRELVEAVPTDNSIADIRKLLGINKGEQSQVKKGL